MWLSSLWARRRQMLVISVVVSVFILAGLETKVGEVPFWIATVNRMLGLAAVWAITHNFLRRNTMAETLARHLLPMCSWCKKVRNQDGQWEELEMYVLRQAKGQVTHGMCTECSERMLSTLPSKRK